MEKNQAALAQEIIDHYQLKANADRIVKEREG